LEVFKYYLINFIVPFLVIFLIVVILVTISDRIVYEYSKQYRLTVRQKITAFLTELLFTDAEDYQNRIRDFKKQIPYGSMWCKSMVTNCIIELKQNIKGEVTAPILDIYKSFGLPNFSEKLINSRRWYIKCKGIYHFQVLEYEEGESLVKKYMNHKNRILRSNAFIAFISLTSKKLDFLSDYPYEISLIDELKVMDLLYHKKFPIPKNIKDWITAQNPSIVKLGIRFMVYYNYTVEKDTLLSLLQSDNKMIRKEVIIALQDLFLFEAEPLLIDMFASEEIENKIAILQTLAVIGNQQSIAFIDDYLHRSVNPATKLEAVRTLDTLDSSYLKSNFKEDFEIIKIKKHVKNPYL